MPAPHPVHPFRIGIVAALVAGIGSSAGLLASPQFGTEYDPVPNARVVLLAAATGVGCALPGGVYLGWRKRAVLDWSLAAALTGAVTGIAIVLALRLSPFVGATAAVAIAGFAAGWAGIRKNARQSVARPYGGRNWLLATLSLGCLAAGTIGYPPGQTESMMAVGFIGLSSAWVLASDPTTPNPLQ